MGCQMFRFTRTLLFLLALASASRLLAQDATGKITGTVTDPTGGAVPNARVTVTNVATNVSKGTTTDSNGVYQVLQLPIGSYKITATAPGFEETAVESKTALEINQTLRIDVQMQIGKVSGEVTVESQASSGGDGEPDHWRNGVRAGDL